VRCRHSRLVPGSLVAAALAVGQPALRGHRLCGGDPHVPPLARATSQPLQASALIWGFVGLAAIVMLSVVALMSSSPGATPDGDEGKERAAPCRLWPRLLVLAPLLVNLVISVAGG